jgi:hypothetical protein
MPELSQHEVKTDKNKHKQTKPNKNWNFMGTNELWRNLVCFWGLRKQLFRFPPPPVKFILSVAEAIVELLRLLIFNKELYKNA